MSWHRAGLAALIFVLAGCNYTATETAKAEMAQARPDLDKTFWIKQISSVEFCPSLGSSLYQKCSHLNSSDGAFVVDNIVQNRLGWTYYHIKLADGRRGYIGSYERSSFITEDPAEMEKRRAEEKAAERKRAEAAIARVVEESKTAGEHAKEEEKKRAEQAAAKAKATRAKAKAECDRKGGVAIGMTAEQIVKSCWGEPEHKNVTITPGLRHEQWVYGGSYLYLSNGILTGIQKTER